MKIGILFSIGSSFSDQKKSGQDLRFVDYYLKKYNQVFEEVDVFSYQDESYSLPEKCFLISNKKKIQRFFYSFLLPFIHREKIKKLDIFRVMQLTGVIPAIIIKILYHKPFVFTYGYDYSEFSKLEGNLIRPLLLKILELIAFKFASGIIVTTKYIEANLKRKYPRANIIFIPNGLDINQFTPRNKLPVASCQLPIFKLLFVGRLEKQKNLINLIKAISLLTDKYNIKLLFIGQGSMEIDLKNLAKKLKINLNIINNIPHNQIVRYYQQADIFVLPSLMEGHPKALLEAMACGLPCLVSAYAGVGDFKKNIEIAVCEDSISDIAKKMDFLIKNKDLRIKLGLNARKRIKNDFDIHNLIKKEILMLRKLTNQYE